MGENRIQELTQNIISHIVTYLNAQIGALYLLDEKGEQLELMSSYAFNKPKKNIKVGEGLVGQSAREKKRILFSNIPENYIKINSGLGEASPNNILVIPFLYKGNVKGIIEIGTSKEFTDLQVEYLEMISDVIAIAIHSVEAGIKMKELLQKTQQQAEELEVQQEELRQINEELMEQQGLLQTSEEELKVQQEELQEKNMELEEKALIMEEQQEVLQLKNKELEEARLAIYNKAEELELTSKYKSEFLANMSHELRTPLNSILILTKILMENREANLSEKQVEFVNVINRSGNDLHVLINDILDLSKIEFGKASIELSHMPVQKIVTNLNTLFISVANEKNIRFTVNMTEDVPAFMYSDEHRVEQLIKNLLSNAFKFTDKGGVVALTISIVNKNTGFKNDYLNKANKVIAFAVSDSGIGVAEDKQKIIFEAFQQADASTSRKYGGTGLGLSISREIASLLGGEIVLESEEGKGSTFTVYLPESAPEPDQIQEIIEQSESAPVKKALAASFNNAEEIARRLPDDRDNITAKDKIILVIEDDVKFAKILQDFAGERGYKTISALHGELGLIYAKKYRPDAIILDIHLPGIDGWSVLNQLKADKEVKHIPVHIISVLENKKMGLERGAIDYIVKPLYKEDLDKAFDEIGAYLKKQLKHVLIIEDNEQSNDSISALLSKDNIKCKAAFTAEEALQLIAVEAFDCIVMDLGLPDKDGFQLLEEIKENPVNSTVPVIIYTGKELSVKEEKRLKKYASTIIVKTVKSYDRLLDEVTLFLHKVDEIVSPEKMLKTGLSLGNDILKSKKVLIVDDDMRNIYSLFNVLEMQSMDVITANNGREALEMLKENPDISMILMDMMMPEMDGYECMKHIRKKDQYKKLPIIALTAKAMKGDKEKCLEAGASDYISKPLDTDKLIALMRIWLYK